MQAYDKQYPHMVFGKHKGYPTKGHIEAFAYLWCDRKTIPEKLWTCRRNESIDTGYFRNKIRK